MAEIIKFPMKLKRKPERSPEHKRRIMAFWWNNYLEARDRAERSRDLSDGILVAAIWKDFLDVYMELEK